MKHIFFLLLGLISLCYGFMVASIGSGTIFWLIWEGIGAFLLCWGILLHRGFFVVHPWIYRSLCSMILIGSLLLLSLTACVLSAFRGEEGEQLDYILVLGAQMRENGPSPVLRYRLDMASDYLKKNSETICIVSGGQGANERYPEAEGMAAYLVEQGIEVQRILLENESLNTMQNIVFSKRLLSDPAASVGIVTNNFHMFRAIHLAKAQGYQSVYQLPAPSTKWVLPNNILRECLGIVKDWMKHNL